MNKKNNKGHVVREVEGEWVQDDSSGEDAQAAEPAYASHSAETPAPAPVTVSSSSSSSSSGSREHPLASNVIEGARPRAVAQYVAAEVIQPVNTFTYHPNINKSREGEFLVGLAKETETQGGRDYIFVGKVYNIDKTKNILQFHTRTSTKDPWTRSCVDAQWHPSVGKRCDECSSANVIKYFPKLNKQNTLPKAVKDFIYEHKIKWTNPGAGDDYPDDNDPEFSDNE